MKLACQGYLSWASYAHRGKQVARGQFLFGPGASRLAAGGNWPKRMGKSISSTQCRIKVAWGPSSISSVALAVTQWECVLPDTLHSIRSLLCNATNATPHERLFNYPNSFRVSVPTWLSSLGPVFLRRHARSSKYEPFVEEVDLVHATPNYAHVRLSNGRETMVPLRDITPMRRAPAPLFDAANQRDVALSGGSSLELKNLSSDHAISADDQQISRRRSALVITLSRAGTTGVLCWVKTFRTIRHRALTTLYVLSLLPNQHHLVPVPMDYGDRHIKGDKSTAMGLFHITEVITLYACNVSAYVVRYLFVFMLLNLCSQLSA